MQLLYRPSAEHGLRGSQVCNFLRKVDGMKRKIPAELDRIADVVLAYRPKPKTKAAKKRTRKAKRDAKTA